MNLGQSNTIKKLILHSKEDASINYINKVNDKQYFESRFVQRDPSYFIVYLSSQTGCNQACRFCHLTQTGQTSMVDATLQDYIDQAKAVLDSVNFEDLKIKGLKKIKFSFMARGEPLLNSTIQNNWDNLRRSLRMLVSNWFDVEFCISTIFPKSYPYSEKPLYKIFNTPDTTLYCSVYSINPEFRKKWLGNALPISDIFKYLHNFNSQSTSFIKFHSSFIEGENDNLKDVSDFNRLISILNPTIPYNIIRYNPYSDIQGKETSVDNLRSIQTILNAKVIDRVGFDVKASCGMFYKEY